MYTKRELEAGPIYGPRGQQGALFLLHRKCPMHFVSLDFGFFRKTIILLASHQIKYMFSRLCIPTRKLNNKFIFLYEYCTLGWKSVTHVF